MITCSFQNAVPLPTKTTQERNTELRLQFPVSSGSLHRKTESEWVPVAPKLTETVQTVAKLPAPEKAGSSSPALAPPIFPSVDVSYHHGSIGFSQH